MPKNTGKQKISFQLENFCFVGSYFELFRNSETDWALSSSVFKFCTFFIYLFCRFKDFSATSLSQIPSSASLD